MKHSFLSASLALSLLLCAGFFSSAASAKETPIGLSLAQVSRGIAEEIPLTPAHPVHGQPRVSGISADKTMLFEVVGNPRNVSLATLLIFPTANTADKAGRAMAMFMANAAPGWNGAFPWLIQAMKYTGTHPNKPFVIVHGSRQYEMFHSKELGNFMLSVSHR